METRPDGSPIPEISSKRFSEIQNNPAQQIAMTDPSEAHKGNHDIGFSVEENIFNKSRLDASLAEQRSNDADLYRSQKAKG